MKFYTSINRIGNTLCYRGYEDGRRVAYRVPFKPTLFVNAKNPNAEWMTLEGKPLEPMKFDSMREASDFMDRYSDVEQMKVYGNSNFTAQFVQEQHPNEIKYDPTLVRVANIDIEVASDDGFPEPDKAEAEVQSICLKYFGGPAIFIWALEDKYDPSKTELDIDPEDIYFVKCDGEVDLLLKFLQFWSSKDTSPDILTGWNTRGFDLPYLINRTAKMIGADTIKKFSPWGMVKPRTLSMKGREQKVYEIAGIEQLDYYDLFQKFGFLSYGVLESYRLDHVAFTVLGEKKLSYEEHGNLYTLYKEDYQKFIDYNIKDVLLVEQIDDKMGLTELALTIAYKGGCNYTDAFGTTQLWDTYIYRELCRRKNVVPPKVDRPDTTIAGGYVKEPKVGRHSWVVSLDLNSLYPHLMMQFNMSPETVSDRRTASVDVDKCLGGTMPESILPDHCIAANGVHFRKDTRGVIPTIIDGLYAERSEVKKEMLDTKRQVEKGVVNRKVADKTITKLNTTQMAIKIMMNSLYGAIANKWFRYYDVRVAEAITLSGQLAIRWAEKTVNTYMNSLLGTKDQDFVIAIDTDSVYVDFGPMVEQMGLTDTAKTVEVLDQIARKKFEPILEQSYQAMAKYMNAYENKMVMSREVIADVGVWTAKKRYILNVHDNEGVRYNVPQLKIMGIEAVKSSTPASCRDALKGLFKVMMTTDEKETQKAIQTFRNHFMTLEPHEVAFPRGVSDVFKWRDRDTVYKSGCPIHVRGALLYNKLLKDLKLTKKYTEIKNGEKIKFLYLDPKNPIRENVIAFPDYLPEEFGLHKYVDHQLMFQKAFLAVVDPVLGAMDWKAEETVSLEDFFG
jgi:DNA polymerase elongation subunit (family B)